MGKVRINYFIIGLMLFRIAYVFIPFVTFFSPRGFNLLSVVALYILVAIELGVNNAISTLLKYLPLYIITIFAIVFSPFSDVKTSMVMQWYMLFQDLLWVLLMSYVISLNNIKINRWLLLFVLACMVLTSLTTFYGCLQHPGLSRGMTGGTLSDSARLLYSSLNIGGFDFIYTLVLSIPLIIYLYKSSNISLLFTVPLLIPFYLAIYQAEYTTALLTSFICLIAFFFPRFGNRQRFIRLIAFLGVSLFIMSLVMTDFLNWLANVVDSDIMRERIISSSEIAASGETDMSSDAGARIDLWMRSLSNFLDHPFFGAGNSGGGHSWLLDNMSMFGLFGVIACIVVYRFTHKLTIIPYKNTEFYYYVFFIFMLQIFLSIVNTRFFINTFIILVPLFYNSYPVFKASRLDKLKKSR